MSPEHTPVLAVAGLETTFRVRGRAAGRKVDIKAVRDITFDVRRGETYALVVSSAGAWVCLMNTPAAMMPTS